MKLTQTVVENDDVSPICVTSVPSRDYWHQLCVMTGWGTTSEGKMNISWSQLRIVIFVTI